MFRTGCMTRMSVPLIVGVLSLVLPCAGSSAGDTWQLLSNNAVPPTQGPRGFDLGLRYTYAEGAPTNPADIAADAADIFGNRLLNGDNSKNWHDPIGHTGGDLTVDFAWPEAHELAKVRIRMVRPQRPRAVEFYTRADKAQEWSKLGELAVEAHENGWYEFLVPQPARLSELRLVFRLKEWGFYIDEVEMWGTPGFVQTAQNARSDSTGGLVLIENATAHANIVIAADASQSVRDAASLLQHSLYRMTGVGLPIVSDAANVDSALLLVGPSRLADAMKLEVKQGEYPTKERWIVRRGGDRIALIGNDAGSYQGTRRAVYEFLEHLGCGWFAPQDHWQVIPKRDRVVVNELNVDVTPAFSSRVIWSPWKIDAAAYGLGGARLITQHIYSEAFTAEDFTAHPEWFALVKGARQAKDAQICFSNPDVIQRMAEFAREYFDKYPDLVAMSTSANDTGGFCECENCRKIGANPSEQSLWFANEVAKEVRKTHPNRHVIYYAYWYTAAAPTRTKAVDHVWTMVINNSCSAHSLDAPGNDGGKTWLSGFRQWKKTGTNLAIYEWYIPASDDKRMATIPWIKADAHLRDLRQYRQLGVEWMFYESYANEDVAFAPVRWPLYYIAAQGMIDPSRSAREILGPACDKLFGPAAEPMLNFYLDAAKAYEQTPVFSYNWHLPAPEKVFTEKIQQALGEHLQQATRLTAEADPVVRQRVEDVHWCWTEALRTLGTITPEKAYAIVAPSGRYLTDRAEVDVKYVRELAGINQDIPVIVVGDQGVERTLASDEMVQLSTERPLVIRTAR